MSGVASNPARAGRWRLGNDRSRSAAFKRVVLADPDLRARRFMAFAVALAQAANVLAMKPLIIVAGLAALLLCVLVREAPRQWVWRAGLMLLTLATGGLVFVEYGKLFARDSGIALLFILGPLKLVETKTTRDFMVVWGMALVLFVASFFENLGLIAALSVAPIIIVYVSALRLFDAPASAPGAATLWQHVKGATAHTLLGIPLAAMLFVLFPRATAPLWGMSDPTKGKSGLSDEMRPGNISSLILSKETAFRVEFENRKPPQQSMYWRGPVLREFDGLTWSAGLSDTPSRMRGDFLNFTPEEHEREAINYTVTVERQESRWLPILELPVAYPSGPAVERAVFLSDAQQVGVRRAANGATQYRAQSFARGSYVADAPDAQSPELKTGPRMWNPRARAFATELATRYPNPTERVRALLKYFNQEKFFYTLNPPLYGSAFGSAGSSAAGNTSIDEFLFEGRKGFCEHYAGATVFLLRASGVPARVVTGYQGGEYQPAGHMIVRQSDAHAWVEVWIDGSWRRVDPTGAVAPDRIEQGIAQSLPETERMLVSTRNWISLTGLSNLWEDASFSYTKWVIGFDRDRQKELLKELGLSGVNPLTALGWMMIAVTASGALMGLAWWLWLKRCERRIDPMLRAWRSLRKRLVKAGLLIAPHETVASALARAALRWPMHAATFAEFSKRYNAARFALADADTKSLPLNLPSHFRLRRQ